MTAPLVAADLMSQKFYSGWGIRTVARGEARHNPMSYTTARSGRTTMP
jgi:glycogen debranching enzyme